MKALRVFLLFLALVLPALLRAAPEPLRLDEIAIVRFYHSTSGEAWVRHGLLSARGSFRETSNERVFTSVTVPAAAFNRDLISYEAWIAYERLSPEAVVNFSASLANGSYRVSERTYLDLLIDPSPKLSHGRLVNLSSRGLVSAATGMIGGFVIDDQHRTVLVRVAGPALAAVGVTDALRDPSVTIYRGATAIFSNDNWGEFSDLAALSAANTRVGATPFPTGSKDAAILLELAPGAYTAHVRSAAGDTGEIVLEVFSVPE